MHPADRAALVMDFAAFARSLPHSPLIALIQRYHWHRPNERVAKWLLMLHDRIAGDAFRVTQAGLARMLGARRTSVTETAMALESRGLIQYHRGDLLLKDRKGLEDFACSCYGVISQDTAEYLESLADATGKPPR